MSVPARLHKVIGLEMLEARLRDLVSPKDPVNSDKVFLVHYEFGSQQALLRVDSAKRKIIYDDIFGRPMNEGMRLRINSALGNAWVIVDLPKLHLMQRGLYVPNDNVSISNPNWVDDTLLKLERFKDHQATPAPLSEQPVTNKAEAFAQGHKKHYGWFNEAHPAKTVSENSDKNTNFINLRRQKNN